MLLEIRTVSALEKVFADAAPEPYPRDIPMTGLLNETQSFQIAYCLTAPSSDDRPMLFFKVSTPMPYRVRKAELVPVRFPCFSDTDDNYLRKSPGLYPDVLIDAPEGKPIRAYIGQWSALWVDIEPDQNTEPGDYSIRIAFFYADGDPVGEVTVPFSVPSTCPMIIGA